MNTTLDREPGLAADVTPLATPAFSAPAHPAVSAADSDDPAPADGESTAARAERPRPIPHVAPQS